MKKDSVSLHPRSIQQFQEKILAWYEKHQRSLPWRKTTDPYKILVSEVMLQQTQVERVIPYYQRFLKRFPTVNALAAAPKVEVLALWSGLGFNMRALRLQQTAQALVRKYQGKVPQQEEELLTLPGIGKYTARAVLAFAFNQPVPVIDTNIRRVILHAFQLPKSLTMAQLEEIAVQIIPKNKSRIWHNALMDYGAMQATAKKTGIKPLSKQSPFTNSPRQVRGHVLKWLLKEKQLSLRKIKAQFPRNDLLEILKGMEKDGLIQRKGQMIVLDEE